MSGYQPTPPQISGYQPTPDNPFYVGMSSPGYQPSAFFPQPHFSYTAMLNQPLFGNMPTQPQMGQPQEESEDDEDFVPETQQQEPVNVNQPTQKQKRKPTSWTPDEEVKLCRAYVDISEDSVIGNAQKNGDYL
jgi:hypothetical protein